MWARAPRSCVLLPCILILDVQFSPSHERGARAHIGLVYNQQFRLKFWSIKKMIRFLQTPGPTKKIVLGGLLLIICAAMVITLVPGGLGSNIGLGGPGAGVVAKVGGQDITTLEVQRQARQMLRQQFPRGGPQAAMLLPFFASRAAEELINEKAVLTEAQRMGLRVTDAELSDELQHSQVASTLFPDGNMASEDVWEDFARRNDLTLPEFLQLEKDFILMRKLRTMVAGSIVVTDAALHDEF